MFSRAAVTSESSLTRSRVAAEVLTQCPECYGKGEVRVDCTRCSGCGKETCHECGGQDSLPAGALSTPWLSCLRCDDTGREKCGACHGCGYKWGPCTSCEGEGGITTEALEAWQNKKQNAQQQREQEHWQYYEEEARRWDAEVSQWFEQDLARRIERRRWQRQNQRQQRWKLWKRRTATVACLVTITTAGFCYGPSGVLWARSEAHRYLPTTFLPLPQRNPAPPFLPSQRRLTRGELRKYSRPRLDLLRHELLARRGLKVTRRDLVLRFKSKSWYHPDTTDPRVAWDRLSPTEQYNLWLLTELLAQSPK